MKKTFALIAIFIIFITGYFYFNKPQAISCKGVEDLHIVKISGDAKELQGHLVFHNPNKMRASLGKVDLKIYLQDVEVGVIHDEFKEAIKGNEDFNFLFQIRYESQQVKHDADKSELPVTINGTAASDALFANYTIPIDLVATVKDTQ